MSLRWVWSLITVCMVAAVTIMMMLSITKIEKGAWQASEDEQARLLLTLLSGELKLPILAGSRDEVETLMQVFVHELPGAMIHLGWANGDSAKIGDGKMPAGIMTLSKLPARAASVPGLHKWYAMGIRYNASYLGTLALHAPGNSWEAYAQEIKIRLAGIALLLALLAGALVYWRSGTVSRALRLLVEASKRIGAGDFSVHLPVRTDNEFGQVASQFNKMVSSLEQREKIHDLYGNYTYPQKVADLFDRDNLTADKHVREASVLAIEMVDFNGFLANVKPAEALAVLNRFFALFDHVIKAYGGHVDHFSSASMLAVFNHPFDVKCHENQAAKAGLSIIEICQRLALSRSDGGEIRFGTGMSRGEIIPGHLGVGRRKGLSIFGSPVSLAVQLAAQSRGDELMAEYGIMLELGHGFKPRELGVRKLANGDEIRCIAVLPGQSYITDEVDDKVGQTFNRIEPADYDDEDDW